MSRIVEKEVRSSRLLTKNASVRKSPVSLSGNRRTDDASCIVFAKNRVGKNGEIVRLSFSLKTVGKSSFDNQIQQSCQTRNSRNLPDKSRKS